MKTGDYVVSHLGGQVFVLGHPSMVKPNKWVCERWAGGGVHQLQLMALDGLRLATKLEIATMLWPKRGA